MSQSREDNLLQEIQNAYTQLNYQEAEIKAKAVLENYNRFSPKQLTEVHKILGIIYFSQNKVEAARQQFENALSLTPDFELDRLFVSPKIVAFFTQVKKQFRAEKDLGGPSKAQVRYVLIEDSRPAATLRSMFLPGWGQLYKGDKTKGRILMALWGVGVAGSIIAHVARQNAEDRYLAETNPARIESRFNTFSRLHKLRNNLLLFSAGVWVFSYLDAILRGKPQHVTASQSNQSILILPTLSSEQARMFVLLRF
ncbi:MAG: hypothetical protein ACE5HO_18230 [bacterium]